MMIQLDLCEIVKITIGPERAMGQRHKATQYVERYITIEDANGECVTLAIHTAAGKTALELEVNT